MKELLKQLATYNVWANQKIMEVILSLPEEKQLAEVPSSFRSIHKTIMHMWDTDSVWWQRMKLQERFTVPSENFKGKTKDAIDGLLQQGKQWEQWVHNASDLSISHVFQYQNLKGEQFKQPIFQMLTHVFNHGTYHRGQLINMLRQLGVDKLPGTDFVLYTRSKK